MKPENVKGDLEIASRIDTALLEAMARGEIIDHEVRYIADDEAIDIFVQLKAPAKVIQLDFVFDGEPMSFKSKPVSGKDLR